MAEVQVVFAFGSSDWEGLLTEILQTSDADWQRYKGLPMQDSFADDVIGRHPFDAPFPGIKMLTPRLPYAVNTQAAITAIPAGDQLTYDATVLGNIVANQIGSWVVIKNNTTGQGNFRRITAGTGTDTITVNSAWSPALAANGTIAFLSDFATGTSISHRFDNPSSSLTGTIAKTGATPAFTAGLIGSHVYLPSATAGNTLRRITAVPSATTLTVEDPFTALPATDTAIILLTGAGSAQSLTGPVGPLTDALSFQDLRAYYGNSTVLLTGLDYTNANLQPTGAGPITLAPSSPMYELLWQFRARFPGTIYGCSLGIDSATISPYQVGDTLRPLFFSWQKDMDHRDFNPTTTNSLYSVLVIFIQKIKALLAAQGHTPKFHIFNLIYENELLDLSRVKVTRIGDNARLLRDSLRAEIGDPGAPFIMIGPGSRAYATLSGSDYDEAYRQLRQVEADDPASGLVDTSAGYSPFAIDGLHFTTAVHPKLGKDCYAKWAETYQRATAAARLRAELPSLGTIRTKVKRRYERTDSGNSNLAAQVDMFINDSLREIYNTLGDSAWFLRVVEEVDFSNAQYPNTITLPRNVRRFLKLERASCPGHSLVVKGLAYTDEGRVQVTLHDYGGGPFLAHFIQNPKELVIDSDVALVPVEYVELVVMLTCKRLGENTGNMGLASYYAAETERLWRLLKREAGRYDRMRQGQLDGMMTFDAWRNGGYPSGSLESL